MAIASISTSLASAFRSICWARTPSKGLDLRWPDTSQSSCPIHQASFQKSIFELELQSHMLFHIGLLYAHYLCPENAMLFFPIIVVPELHRTSALTHYSETCGPSSKDKFSVQAFLHSSFMENYQVTLKRMDLELRRVNDTQLDTIRRNCLHNVAVKAEWRRRQPRPPPTAREIEMEANRTIATETSDSNSRIRAMVSESGLLKSEIRENIAGTWRGILEEISRLEETGNCWPFQHPHLREERLNVEESANIGDTRHYDITRGNNATRDQHTWVQELAMQIIIFNSLLVVNPQDNQLGPPNTARLSDKEGDADEEDNIDKISRGLREVHVQESNQKWEVGRSQETDEGADGDDDNSSFEPSEPEYVFVTQKDDLEKLGPGIS